MEELGCDAVYRRYEAGEAAHENELRLRCLLSREG